MSTAACSTLSLKRYRQLKNRHLKQLSLVSRRMHRAVSEALWRSVTIKPCSESRVDLLAFDLPNAAGLRPKHLRYARHLHFHSDIRHASSKRCPDTEFDLRQPGREESAAEDGRAIEEGEGDLTRVERLTQRATSVLRHMSRDQLHSFRCVSVPRTPFYRSLRNPPTRHLAGTWAPASPTRSSACAGWCRGCTPRCDR